uniref:Proline-rich peptide 10c n=1 Tax=Bitis nasicornis TaxID=8695 RepID=BPPAC_BITNA
QNWPRPKVPP